MTVRTWPRRWREVKRRPIQGNSPDDRILRGPDCNRPKRVYADSFPATPWPTFPKTHKTPGRRFLRHAESIGPMCSSNPRPECRLPLVGPRAPVKERDGRSALCSSSAMSSDRLFLDRVARQHCPSPLHRHAQTTTHLLSASSKPDISTLQRIGHFYFALAGATFRRRAAEGPGAPAQTRGSAPPGAESGSIREWDLVGLLEVDPRNWVRLGFLLFRLRPIRGGGRGGVRSLRWRGGIGARSGPGSAERVPRCGASECSCGSPWRARNCDSGRG